MRQIDPDSMVEGMRAPVRRRLWGGGVNKLRPRDNRGSPRRFAFWIRHFAKSREV